MPRRAWSEAPQINLPAPRDTQRPEDLRALSNNPIPDRHSSAPSLSPTAANLVKAYPLKNTVEVLGSSNAPELASALLATAQSDREIEIRKLFRQARCYSFTQLHGKGRSVKPIEQEIQNAFPGVSVYHILRIGAKWSEIVGQFGTIVNRAPQHLTGLLCLLGSASAWERASANDRRSALVNLYANTDICDRALELTPLVSNVLSRLSLNRPFIDETYRHTLISPSSGATPLSQSGRGSLRPGVASTCRALQPLATPMHTPQAPSIPTVLETIVRQDVCSDRIDDSIIGPSPRWAGAAQFTDNEFVFQLNRNDVRGFFSGPHSPSPPRALLVSENLFHHIKVYFENSCRNMNFDDHGNLLTPNGAKWDNALCNDFDSYCFTATMLLEKGLHVDFRRALSKASALVEQILRAEHPRTLACFLEVFIHLIQTGHPEVTSSLCDYIRRMAANVTSKGNPWGQICRLLGELDTESLDQAMAQIWKCTTDIFDSELGTFNRLAVSVRLDYMKRVVTNHLEEERLLRDLLAQFGGIPRLPTPRVMLNLAHNLNKQGRHDEAEETALEVLSLLQGNETYAWRIVERIESLKIVSRSQFNQGKTLAAEQTMREAIQMIVDWWGIQHSWVPEFMNVLEGWLRVWGRKEDADTLRGEIEELMGRDEMDEELDGVQGLLC